jgi:hypothetical protein
MGQRVYVLSLNEYSDILGIFTNIRQCRKFIEKLKDTNGEMHINVGKGVPLPSPTLIGKVLLLHEIRLNEPEKGRTNITKLLDENIKENKLEEIEKSEK